MEKINKELMDFIDRSPNAYSCIDNLKNILNECGYQQKFDNTFSVLKDGEKYYITKGDSSIIAFQMPKKYFKNRFNIVATHTDSPSFSIKVNPEMYENGYLKLNVEGYGSMINYTWFDRPLSIAGRVVYQENGVYKTKVINIDKDLLIIPSQAIHVNREVNEKAVFNRQIDMIPIISLENKSFKEMVAEELVSENISFDKICDYDFYLYNRDKAKTCGANGEFILSPRLDDLACVYPALKSFIESSNNDSVNVFCAFNNEEIGSLTKQGADSNFLLDVLTRIMNISNNDLYRAFDNSLIISADNAHAIHPNASSKTDQTNKVELNKGIVIKHHKNYTTDALSSSIFKGICDDRNVPYQDFTCRSDMICGATLGGINNSHVGIDSIDIGLAQLAMHSANETMGSKDIKYLYDALSEFYGSSIVKEEGTVRVVKQKK